MPCRPPITAAQLSLQLAVCTLAIRYLHISTFTQRDYQCGFSLNAVLEDDCWKSDIFRCCGENWSEVVSVCESGLLDCIIYHRVMMQKILTIHINDHWVGYCRDVRSALTCHRVSACPLFQSQGALCQVPLFQGELRMYTRPETSFWHHLGLRLLGFCGKTVVCECFLKTTLELHFIRELHTFIDRQKCHSYCWRVLLKQTVTMPWCSRDKRLGTAPGLSCTSYFRILHTYSSLLALY